jgi:predicted RNA-binding Zn-ribbon protein involved in translation (DUF1610 family)
MANNSQKQNAPGPLRLAIRFLSVLLTLFFIWLLSFLLNDSGDLPGPDYNAIQKRHVPQEKLDEANDLGAQLAGVEKQIKRQREIHTARRSHDLKIASLKLALVVPLLLLAAWLVRKKRGGIYQPFNGAALFATFWMVWLVMWDHFPRDFFKYIAILAAIGILGAFLAWAIRSSARPRTATLLKRYREACQNHRCRACDFPILRGAFRQAVWTKRGPKLAGEALGQAESSRYTCPSCGEGLFDKCGACGEVTQSLLPYCSACGRES